MSSDPGRVERIARYFHDIHAGRKRLPALPAEVRPGDLDEAYAAQEALSALFVPERGPIVGYKVAVTTPVMQRLMGIDRPCAGAIYQKLVHSSPAVLRASDYGRVAVECEIAMRLGADLPGGARAYDRDGVAAAVEACMPAIEIIEDHNADYKETEALGLVANNAWNCGCVLGPATAAWRELDLTKVEGAMTINGREIGRGRGADVMGDPLNALAWVANTQVRRGRPLRRGMVVMTGSVVSTQWPKPGDTVSVSFTGLGEASLRLSE